MPNFTAEPIGIMTLDRTDSLAIRPLNTTIRAATIKAPNTNLKISIVVNSLNAPMYLLITSAYAEIAPITSKHLIFNNMMYVESDGLYVTCIEAMRWHNMVDVENDILDWLWSHGLYGGTRVSAENEWDFYFAGVFTSTHVKVYRIVQPGYIGLLIALEGSFNEEDTIECSH